MQEPYIGSIHYFAFNFAPYPYVLCDGAQLQINENGALFYLFSNYYGGDGKTTFNLPDLRGKMMIGQSNSYSMGNTGGTESVALPPTSLAMHTHTPPLLRIPANSGYGTTQDSGAAYMAVPDSGADTLYAPYPSGAYLGGVSLRLLMAGAGQPVDILSPYIALTCCIALKGSFPSRA